MTECDTPDCPCHDGPVEMPPHVTARLDQIIAELTDQH